MGCSSSRPPCQPCQPCQPCAGAEHLPAPDSEHGPPQDGATAAMDKAPESVSTLERLALATGGTEKSWYRCVFPFGFISLVIGMAGSGVTFTFNTLPQTRVVSLVLLTVGLVLLLVAAVCWKVERARRREKKEGGFFSAEQGAL